MLPRQYHMYTGQTDHSLCWTPSPRGRLLPKEPETQQSATINLDELNFWPFYQRF